MANLTYAEISELLKYEPETGKLFWLPRTPDKFKNGVRDQEATCRWWNGRFAGKEAFTTESTFGYRTGLVYRRSYKAHRVIWFLHTGAWPVNDIDHINGVKNDNRIVNLRDIPRSENMKNKKGYRANSSGINGVFWRQDQKRWQAGIRLGGVQKHLGSFINMEDAAAARRAAEIELGFHPNHGR